MPQDRRGGCSAERNQVHGRRLAEGRNSRQPQITLQKAQEERSLSGRQRKARLTCELCGRLFCGATVVSIRIIAARTTPANSLSRLRAFVAAS